MKHCLIALLLTICLLGSDWMGAGKYGYLIDRVCIDGYEHVVTRTAGNWGGAGGSSTEQTFGGNNSPKKCKCPVGGVSYRYQREDGSFTDTIQAEKTYNKRRNHE